MFFSDKYCKGKRDYEEEYGIVGKVDDGACQVKYKMHNSHFGGCGNFRAFECDMGRWVM